MELVFPATEERRSLFYSTNHMRHRRNGQGRHRHACFAERNATVPGFCLIMHTPTFAKETMPGSGLLLAACNNPTRLIFISHILYTDLYMQGDIRSEIETL